MGTGVKASEWRAGAKIPRPKPAGRGAPSDPARSAQETRRRQLAASLSVRAEPGFSHRPPVSLAWSVEVRLPYEPKAWTKNAEYGYGRDRVWISKDHRTAREHLGALIALAMRGRTVATNKLWLDILVERPNHSSDAINVLDGVADAVKSVIDLDDRWFAVRRLDWTVVPLGGQLYVALGQEHTWAARICSSCGRVLPLDQFGRGRLCRTCATLLRTSRS